MTPEYQSARKCFSSMGVPGGTTTKSPSQSPRSCAAATPPFLRSPHSGGQTGQPSPWPAAGLVRAPPYAACGYKPAVCNAPSWFAAGFGPFFPVLLNVARVVRKNRRNLVANVAVRLEKGPRLPGQFRKTRPPRTQEIPMQSSLLGTTGRESGHEADQRLGAQAVAQDNRIDRPSDASIARCKRSSAVPGAVCKLTSRVSVAMPAGRNGLISSIMTRHDMSFGFSITGTKTQYTRVFVKNPSATIYYRCAYEHNGYDTAGSSRGPEAFSISTAALERNWRSKAWAPLWATSGNLSHPDRVASVHRKYVEAGSQLHQHDTFNANLSRWSATA